MRRLWCVLGVATAIVTAIPAWPGGAGGGDPRTAAVRAKYFGAENVDPATGAVRADRVILSWFGVTNFAAAIGGHVVLLDAWIPRGEYSGYVPASPAELAALKPEYLFVGHGHFDHLADAADVMSLSPSTTLVGTPEHCAQVRERAANPALRCLDAVPAAAAPGTENLNLAARLGWNDVQAGVIKHLHSAARAPDASDPQTPVAPPPDLSVIAANPPAPADTMDLISHQNDEEGGVLLYRFDVGRFSLAWHDSSGPLKEDDPEVLSQIARDFGPVDVEVSSIQTFNQITNGLADPRAYIEALRPTIFVPAHHDNWAPPVSTNAEGYRAPVEAELAKIPPAQRPQLLFMTDPEDYVNPGVLTFSVSDARWAGAGDRARTARPRAPVVRGEKVRPALPATGLAETASTVLGGILLMAAGWLGWWTRARGA